MPVSCCDWGSSVFLSSGDEKRNSMGQTVLMAVLACSTGLILPSLWSWSSSLPTLCARSKSVESDSTRSASRSGGEAEPTRAGMVGSSGSLGPLVGVMYRSS